MPSKYCRNFNYEEGAVKYDVGKIAFCENAHGCLISLPLADDEQIYGLGLQLKSFNHRGKKLAARVNADPVAATGDSHAPVPFFVSTRGYGVYFDTARYAEFYFGSSKKLCNVGTAGQEKALGTSETELYASRGEGNTGIDVQIPVAKGIDIYIIEGRNITDVVSEYNMLSGGGAVAPEWALKPLYRCYTKSSQQDVLELARHFKNSNLPIFTIGIEPGWQTKAYSCSYVWNTERFPNHREMLNELREMGYHINLWEHAFVNPAAPFFNEIKEYSGEYAVWNGCVPDFATDEAQEIFANYHKDLVAEGIDGFKLDECDSSDYTNSWSFPNFSRFPSGLDGEQYHSLFGTLYMQAIMRSLGDILILSEVRNAGALAASYPFVLYSDLYDHSDFVRGCCTAGFSGLLWTPEVRYVESKTKEEFLRRLQSNVFSVQCLINGWNYEQMPWKELDCEDEVRELLEIRIRLVPMLKKAFELYNTKGVPPVRALVCDYTSDNETYNIDDEYLFCENLLVAPIIYGKTEREVYIPRGNWRDYFSKEPVQNGWFTVKTYGIPVYEKY